MKRCEFFKVVFGAIGSAITMPMTLPFYPAGSHLKRDFLSFREVANFSSESLAAGSRHILTLPPITAAKNTVNGIGLWYDQGCKLNALAEFMENIEITVLNRNRDVAHLRPCYMNGLQALPYGLVADDFSIVLEGVQVWTPPEGLHSQIVVQSIRVSEHLPQIEP